MITFWCTLSLSLFPNRSVDRPLGYQVINLGNGRPFKLSDFISLVEKCVGKKALIQVNRRKHTPYLTYRNTNTLLTCCTLPLPYVPLPYPTVQVLPEQPGDVERTCADISKARELLGYDPKVTAHALPSWQQELNNNNNTNNNGNNDNTLSHDKYLTFS